MRLFLCFLDNMFVFFKLRLHYGVQFHKPHVNLSNTNETTDYYINKYFIE